MGPEGYKGTPFSQMDQRTRERYESDVNSIWHKMYYGEPVGRRWENFLDSAIEYQMLWYPDGTPVTADDREKLRSSEYDLSTLVFAVPDVRNGTNKFYSVFMTDDEPKMVKADRDHPLTPAGIREKAHKRISHEWNKKLIGGDLEKALKKAIEQGVVSYIDGTVPEAKDVKAIAAIPSLVNDLVFSFHENYENPEELTQYRFKPWNQAVFLDMDHPLTEEERVRMRENSDEWRKPINLIGQAAKAADDMVNPNNRLLYPQYLSAVKWYKEEFARRGMLHSLNGTSYIYLPSEKAVYPFGSNQPMKRKEFLTSLQIKKPDKPAKKWGRFEFLRGYWHKYVSRQDDMTLYERQMRVYETSRYNALTAVGFEGIEKPESMDAYEKQQKWVDDFLQLELTDNQRSFFEALKKAFEKYPDIADKVMEEIPNVNTIPLDGYNTAAEPYSFLGDKGTLSQSALGELSPLAVAAESGLFSEKTKALITKAAQDKGKDIRSAAGERAYLTEDQNKALGVDKKKVDAGVQKIRKKCAGLEVGECGTLVNLFVEAANQDNEVGAAILKKLPKLRRSALADIARRYAAVKDAEVGDMRISETTVFANVCRDYLPKSIRQPITERYNEEKAAYDEYQGKVQAADKQEKERLRDQWNSGEYLSNYRNRGIIREVQKEMSQPLEQDSAAKGRKARESIDLRRQHQFEEMLRERGIDPEKSPDLKTVQAVSRNQTANRPADSVDQGERVNADDQIQPGRNQ